MSGMRLDNLRTSSGNTALPGGLQVVRRRWYVGHGLAKSSNPPLSKEIFLQERGLADDHWEDETYGDHDDWGEDDESGEDN